MLSHFRYRVVVNQKDARAFHCEAVPALQLEHPRRDGPHLDAAADQLQLNMPGLRMVRHIGERKRLKLTATLTFK